MMENRTYGFMVARRPVEDCFDYALEHNIQHLEIDLKKKHSLLDTFTPERIARIREFTGRNGIALSLHPPYNMNVCSQFPWIRHAYVVYLKECIQLAHVLNARHLTLHLGNFYRFAVWANPRHHALARLMKVLRKLIPTCEEYGVYLALENMIPIPPEAGYVFLGDNVKDFEEVFSPRESPYLRFCLDVGHANTAEGPLEYVEKLGDKLLSVHFHDNMGQYDDHLDVGKGTVPWAALMDALAKVNFKGPFISECFNSPPHEAIELLKKYSL